MRILYVNIRRHSRVTRYAWEQGEKNLGLTMQLCVISAQNVSTLGAFFPYNYRWDLENQLAGFGSITTRERKMGLSYT